MVLGTVLVEYERLAGELAVFENVAAVDLPERSKGGVAAPFFVVEKEGCVAWQAAGDEGVPGRLFVEGLPESGESLEGDGAVFGGVYG